MSHTVQTASPAADAGTTPQAATISLKDIHHSFFPPGRKPVVAVRGVNLEVKQGEFLAIIGPSGCGKTTLLNIIAGLERPTEGVVEVFGSEPVLGNRDIRYLFARDALLPWRTAERNVALSLKYSAVPKREHATRTRDVLESVDLGDFVKSYPAALSQGMRQRVALARTIVTEPRVLLMDEPFSALDAQTRLQVQELFLRVLERLNCTVVLITHDLSEAVALADRVVLMTKRPGEIKNIYEISLERPRNLGDMQSSEIFHGYYSTIWNDLRDEFLA